VFAEVLSNYKVADVCMNRVQDQLKKQRASFKIITTVHPYGFDFSDQHICISRESLEQTIFDFAVIELNNAVIFYDGVCFWVEVEYFLGDSMYKAKTPTKYLGDLKNLSQFH
jgi:hypothetical protein